MSPSNVNNAIRELMAQLKNMEDGTDAVTAIKSGNIQITGNTVSSTDLNGNINITPNGTGNVVLDGINYPQADGTANYFLKTDGAGQLSFAQVDTASIAADAIDGTKIADDSIDSEHYVDGSIDTAHLADTAVTDAKISGMSSSKLSGALPAIDGSALTGISAGLPGPRTEIFTSSGTFTVPSGVTACKVTVVGGGGGSGGVSGIASATSGGGGGGTAIKWITGLTSGGTVSVTIGAGGAAGAANAGTGGSGGTSSFGAYCSATGGVGSDGEFDNSTGDNTTEVGGSATGGDFNIDGGQGGRPIHSSNYSWSYSGGGGAPMGKAGFNMDYFWDGLEGIDGGRILQYASSPGNSRNHSVFGGYGGGSSYQPGAEDGTGYGCGAGGCSNTQSADRVGGSGYQGVVIVEY
jgi:hypothetical protein